MAVPKHLISTLDQAYDYATGSANAASRGVCPSQSYVYQELASKVTIGAFGTNFLDKNSWNAALAAADARCIAAPDYAERTGVQTAPTGTPSTAPKIDPSTGGAAPDTHANGNGIIAAGIGAGIPWWVWVAGGAALFLIFGDKKKGKRKSKKGKRKSRRRR